MGPKSYNRIVVIVLGALSIVIALLIIGCKCKNVNADWESRVSMDAINPDCGPINEDIEVHLYGYGLDKATKVTLGSQVYLPGDFTVGLNGEVIAFTARSTTEATHILTVTFEDDFACLDKDGKPKESGKKETLTATLVGPSFTFVGSAPWVTHTAPYEWGTDPDHGNCGGGYSIDIHGANFGDAGDTDVRVTFVTDGISCSVLKRVMVAYPDVTVIGDDRIRVMVPHVLQNCKATVVVEKNIDDCDVRCTQCGWFQFDDPECVGPDIRYFPAGSGPIKLATGEVFNDPAALDPGYKDVVAICPESKSLIVYRGMGDGNIGVVDMLDLVTSPKELALGRFDDNDYDDVAVLFEDGTVVVYYSSGTGYANIASELDSLKDYQGSLLADLAVLDINDDGFDDIVLANQSGDDGTLAIYEIESAKDFKAAIEILVTYKAEVQPEGSHVLPVSLAVGDFTSEFGYDLLVATNLSTIELLSTESDPPFFTSHAELLDEDGSRSTIADLVSCQVNSDNADADVAVINEGDDNIYFITGKDGTFAPAYAGLTLNGSDPFVMTEGFYCKESHDQRDYPVSDFAVARETNMIEVFLRGAGAADPNESIQLPFRISDLASDYLNSIDIDTYEDLVVGTDASTIIVIVNNGAGF